MLLCNFVLLLGFILNGVDFAELASSSSSGCDLRTTPSNAASGSCYVGKLTETSPLLRVAE